ncbi:MAG: acetylglutamate kinase [Bacteroidales bacterium]|nr:acetylglutamate kinase [Bacteroidales bacterium]
MKQVVNVIKIGGNIIDNDAALTQFLSDFATLDELKILVHGGGKLATRLAEQLGVPVQMHDGRRITDSETLKIATMVYAGWINKTIVAKLQHLNCNAIGLSGADTNVIPAERRSSVSIDFGFVGDIQSEKINFSFLNMLLQQQICPVFCGITHDKQGNLLNSNADTIASSLAANLSSKYDTRLTFCFEKNGVLFNPDDDHSAIPKITPTTYAALKANGVITAGMIPKIDNAFKAIDAGVTEVIIKHAKNLLNDFGTKIKNI